MSRVVVTGAGRGLGRALALGYLQRGWEVWAGCRDPGRAADLGAHGGPLDVTDEDAVREFAAAIPGNVDVLIKCGWG